MMQQTKKNKKTASDDPLRLADKKEKSPPQRPQWSRWSNSSTRLSLDLLCEADVAAGGIATWD